MALKDEQQKQQYFPLGRQNYMYMAISFAVILIGFALMAGGKSEDPNVFNPEVFSFQRITLAPIVVMIGFVGVIYAILKKAK